VPLNKNLEVFPVVSGETGQLDGCYITEDTNTGQLFRSGATVCGFEKRWAGHDRASRLNDGNNQYRGFYQSYPHKQAANKAPNKRGTFDTLKQRIGLGVDKKDRTTLVGLV
jgi:hypothetical protein